MDKISQKEITQIISYYEYFAVCSYPLLLNLQDDISEQVVETLMYFMNLGDMSLRYYTLQSLGFVCIRHYELMMGTQLKQLYHMLLLDPSVNTKLRIQTLQNIETYLQEEEVRMIKQDQECKIYSVLFCFVLLILLQCIQHALKFSQCILPPSYSTRY